MPGLKLESQARRRFQHRLRSFQQWSVKQIYQDAVFISVVLLIGSSLIVSLFIADFRNWKDEFWKGVFIEFTGMMFDIAVFGVLIVLFLRLTERRREIHRQQEIIDDFKKWNSDEARFRIAGAVRRLNRLGKTNIDFRGIILKNFSFKSQDIESIRGAIFYDGEWGYISPRIKTLLENVAFDHVDCSNVTFSAFNPFKGISLDPPMQMKNCSFNNANLHNVKFCGAKLFWDQKPPDETGEGVEDEDGSRGWVQTYFSPFYEADLKGASFADADLKNADFRDTKNIIGADFSNATGLETCIFDSNEIRDIVLSGAKGSKK